MHARGSPSPARPLNGVALARTNLAGDPMDLKTKAVQDRIESFQQAIQKANEYLVSGKHADWNGFRPLFDRKYRDGKELPPHKDWVKNVFLPNKQKALRGAERLLERLRLASRSRAG